MMPSASIAAFAESLVEGRRVLLLGSSGHNLWQKLLDRGARLIHVCDPDPLRLAASTAQGSAPNVSFAAFSNQAALALRDSVFDIGIVDNLAAFADPAEVLRILRKALAPRAIAFVTAPNPDVRESLLPDITPQRLALDYYSLYDVVRAEFPIVRMLGQMPFVGYTLAELAPQDDPEPLIDAGFVPGGTEEPEWFVATASAVPFEINSFTVVQVPVAEVLHHSSERQLREQLRVSRSAERSAVERLARLEAQQIEMASRAAETKQREDANRQVSELKGDLKSREDRIIFLEAKVVATETRLFDAQRQQDEMRQSLARAQHAEAERTALAQHVADATERAQRNEAERAALAQQITDATERANTAGEVANDAEADVARLEAQLCERGVRVRELETELKAAERVGQQLLRDLEAARRGHHRQFGNEAWSIASAPLAPEPLAPDTAQPSGTTSAWAPSQVDGSAGNDAAVLPANVPQIAEDRARLQADLVAAKWRVDQLLSVIEKTQPTEERQALLKSQLCEAQSRLNEQAALLSQLESSGIRS